MRPIHFIVVHCSATPPAMDIGVDVIRKWHVDERGWSDVGYHWVIKRRGKVEAGRPESRVPASVRGFNEKTLAICLVGGVDRYFNSDDNFTKRQKSALLNLIFNKRQQYDIWSIVGHRDFPRVWKDCPSFNVLEWLWGEL